MKYRIIAALGIALAWASPAGAQVMMSPPINGYGTLAATAASTALSTLTAGPNSNAWKMPLAVPLTVYNAAGSAGLVYVCPFGGTCSAAVGIPIAVGTALPVFNLGGSTVSPTVFAVTTATVIAWW
jgi:hypothetical protein